MRLQPADAIGHCGLGVAYYKLKRYREAAQSFARAITLDENYAVAHYNLGVVHLARRDRGLALAQYRVLVSLDHSLADSLFAGIYRGKILSVVSK